MFTQSVARGSLPRGEATRRAVAYLGEFLAACNGRVPGIFELARRAGVGYGAMWRAVQEFKRRGCLAAAPRRGITLIGPPGNGVSGSAPPAPSQPRWQSIAGELSRWCLESAHAGPLTVKDLVRTYASCHATVRKALEHLAAAGYVERQGRRYRLAARSPRPAADRMALVAFGNQGAVDLVSGRTQPHLQALERACARAGVSLDTWVCSPDGALWRTGAEVRRIDDISAAGKALGYCFWPIAIPPEVASSVAKRLARTGRPVAVLDETGSPPDCRVAGRSRVQLFRMACGPQPGMRMGTLLRGRGHRCIAYLSGTHAPGSVSHDRLRGLRQAFSAPPGLSVHFEHLAQPGTGQRRSEGADERIRRSLTRHFPHLARSDAATVKQAMDMMRDLALRSRLLEAYRSQFRRLLERTEITAWVAYNDELALGALQFLRDSGVDVPGRMSLASFDNNIYAHITRLTTYDFNGEACIEAMVSFVLGAPVRGRAADGAYEVEGFVVERDTTAGPAAERPSGAPASA